MIRKALVTEFQNVAGKQNVMTDEADRLTFSHDAAVLKPEMQALAVRPADGEALGQVVRLCFICFVLAGYLIDFLRPVANRRHVAFLIQLFLLPLIGFDRENSNRKCC